MAASNERLQSIGLLWLRLAGLAMATHGYAKIFEGQITQLTEGVAKMGFPMPVAFAWAAALSEFAGGLLIAAGLGTRIAAGFLFITMSVALFIVHAKDPFSTKEMAFLYWTISSTLIFTGPGMFSLDRLVRRGKG